ncbi:MAG TPA: hypothetical protein VM204_02675 [Gaiellaceae bacterium]|nr:hypothetical protein [Gaiellaceae bacterium]
MKRGLVTLVAALALAPAAHAGGPTLALGAAEDIVRSASATEAKANMTLLRLAGFRAVRITSIWAPGQTAPTAAELAVLRNVAAAASLSGVRVYLSVYHAGSRTTPLTPEARGELADYAAAIARAVPTFRDVIVGNEPNLNRFWLPQFNPDGSGASAPAYLELLATAYDRLKAVSPAVKVYGGALAPRGVDRPGTGRDTISPTRFIRELGAAYRASGRALPVMDAFAFHPYAANSSTPPDARPADPDHLGLNDYERLVGLLAEAFDGTAQPGSTLPILYDEFGVESIIPPAKASLYSGTEPATTRPVDEATQASFYRRALQLAYCQPNVVGLLLFHTHDEPQLATWQSGVYYADGSPKASLGPVRDALAATRGGSIARCGASLPLKPKVTWAPRTLSFSLRCDLDCVWRARLVRLPAGGTTVAASGRGKAETPVAVSLRRKVRPGRYRLEVSLVHPVNPAPPLVVRSAPFAVR